LQEHKIRERRRAELIAQGIIKAEDISSDEGDGKKQKSSVVKKNRNKNKKQ